MTLRDRRIVARHKGGSFNSSIRLGYTSCAAFEPVVRPLEVVFSRTGAASDTGEKTPGNRGGGNNATSDPLGIFRRT